MKPLYADPWFTFRFADDRIIPRFHLEGVSTGQRVAVFKIDPATGERLAQLAMAIVGEGGWVDLAEPIVVRAGEAFIAEPQSNAQPGGQAVVVRLISGGQTGVDRAALDLALELGIPCGGWCPKGRKAEDGPIPDRYPMEETASTSYKRRTQWNVRDSHGTLILTEGTPTGGTLRTVNACKRLGKPYLLVDLADAANRSAAVRSVWEWLATVMRAKCLNVAGPRESNCPGIGERTGAFLRAVLTQGQD